MVLKLIGAVIVVSAATWGVSIGFNAIRPLESQDQAQATAYQVVDSMHLGGKPVVGWSLDSSRFDTAMTLSDGHGNLVPNCLGGGLPGLCIADPVWRFHFVAPPQSGYFIDSSVAIDARSGLSVGECDAGVSVIGADGSRPAPSCKLSILVGDSTSDA